MSTTPKEERAFQAIERKLEAARRAQLRVDKLLTDVFEAVSALGIEPDEIPTEAENACNLEEAISCYISWGEYSISGLLNEIRMAYDQK